MLTQELGQKRKLYHETMCVEFWILTRSELKLYKMKLENKLIRYSPIFGNTAGKLMIQLIRIYEQRTVTDLVFNRNLMMANWHC